MFSQEEKWLLEEGFGGEKSEAFFAARTKLQNGTPLAYLIGHIPFLNCKIYLDSKPLIPRPETEFWTEKVITEINNRQSDQTNPLRVLDLCAGSGCVGVAVGANHTNVTVDFIELADHQSTILKNCLANNLSAERFNIFQGDLFLPLAKQKYDFILSNPPYIDKTLNRVEPTVANHEPSLALYGGADGLDLIAQIITKAPQFLLPNGQLWLEHEPEQVEKINHLANKANLTITNHQDQHQRNRFSKLVLQ